MSRYKINDDGELLYDPAYEHVLRGEANNKLFMERMIALMDNDLKLNIK